MKRFLAIIAIFIFAVCFTACKKEQGTTVVPDKVASCTLSFESPEITCTLPDPISATVGAGVTDLPYPKDAVGVPEYMHLQWFTDEELTVPYLGDALISDTVLYLGLVPNVYSITYEYDKNLTFQGDFPTTYVYGELTPLPTRKENKGYQANGKWVYGEGEDAYFTMAISPTVYGDLNLVYQVEPIKYRISYALSGVDATNPNPVEYDITMGTITLLPAVAEGKEFDYWQYASTNAHDPLIGSKVESLDFDFVYEHSFTLKAVWKS